MEIDFCVQIENEKPFKCVLEKFRGAAEAKALDFTLKESNWNVSAAARMLGTSRVTLYRLMEKHGIQAVREMAAKQC